MASFNFSIINYGNNKKVMTSQLLMAVLGNNFTNTNGTNKYQINPYSVSIDTVALDGFDWTINSTDMITQNQTRLQDIFSSVCKVVTNDICVVAVPVVHNTSIALQAWLTDLSDWEMNLTRCVFDIYDSEFNNSRLFVQTDLIVEAIFGAHFLNTSVDNNFIFNTFQSTMEDLNLTVVKVGQSGSSNNNRKRRSPVTNTVKEIHTVLRVADSSNSSLKSVLKVLVDRAVLGCFNVPGIVSVSALSMQVNDGVKTVSVPYSTQSWIGSFSANQTAVQNISHAIRGTCLLSGYYCEVRIDDSSGKFIIATINITDKSLALLPNASAIVKEISLNVSKTLNGSFSIKDSAQSYNDGDLVCVLNATSNCTAGGFTVTNLAVAVNCSLERLAIDVGGTPATSVYYISGHPGNTSMFGAYPVAPVLWTLTSTVVVKCNGSEVSAESVELYSTWPGNISVVVSSPGAVNSTNVTVIGTSACQLSINTKLTRSLVLAGFRLLINLTSHSIVDRLTFNIPTLGVSVMNVHHPSGVYDVYLEAVDCCHTAFDSVVLEVNFTSECSHNDLNLTASFRPFEQDCVNGLAQVTLVPDHGNFGNLTSQYCHLDTSCCEAPFNYSTVTLTTRSKFSNESLNLLNNVLLNTTSSYSAITFTSVGGEMVKLPNVTTTLPGMEVSPVNKTVCNITGRLCTITLQNSNSFLCGYIGFSSNCSSGLSLLIRQNGSFTPAQVFKYSDKGVEYGAYPAVPWKVNLRVIELTLNCTQTFSVYAVQVLALKYPVQKYVEMGVLPADQYNITNYNCSTTNSCLPQHPNASKQIQCSGDNCNVRVECNKSNTVLGFRANVSYVAEQHDECILDVMVLQGENAQKNITQTFPYNSQNIYDVFFNENLETFTIKPYFICLLADFPKFAIEIESIYYQVPLPPGDVNYKVHMSITNLNFTGELLKPSSSDYSNLTYQLTVALIKAFDSSIPGRALGVGNFMYGNGSVTVQFDLPLNGSTPITTEDLPNVKNSIVTSMKNNGYTVDPNSLVFDIINPKPTTTTAAPNEPLQLILAASLGAVGTLLIVCIIITIVICKVCSQRTRELHDELDRVSARDITFGGSINFGMTPRSSYSVADRDYYGSRLPEDRRSKSSGSSEGGDMFVFPSTTANGYFPPVGERGMTGYVPQKTRVHHYSLDSDDDIDQLPNRQSRHKHRSTGREMDYLDIRTRRSSRFESIHNNRPYNRSESIPNSHMHEHRSASIPNVYRADSIADLHRTNDIPTIYRTESISNIYQAESSHNSKQYEKKVHRQHSQEGSRLTRTYSLSDDRAVGKQSADQRTRIGGGMEPRVTREERKEEVNRAVREGREIPRAIGVLSPSHDEGYATSPDITNHALRPYWAADKDASPQPSGFLSRLSKSIVRKRPDTIHRNTPAWLEEDRLH